MDPSRFRRLCGGLHHLSPRQVSEIEARLAGLGGCIDNRPNEPEGGLTAESK